MTIGENMKYDCDKDEAVSKFDEKFKIYKNGAEVYRHAKVESDNRGLVIETIKFLMDPYYNPYPKEDDDR